MIAESMSAAGAIALMVGVGILVAGSGWLVIEVARRTADGRLGPNGWAGVRTRATRSSPEAWRVAHEVAERPTVRCGQILIGGAFVAGLAAIVVGRGDVDDATGAWGIVLGATGLVGLAFAVVGGIRGHQAARDLITATDDA